MHEVIELGDSTTVRDAVVRMELPSGGEIVVWRSTATFHGDESVHEWVSHFAELAVDSGFGDLAEVSLEPEHIDALIAALQTVKAQLNPS